MFDDPVLVAASCAVQAHLEILVVDHDMVEGKLTVGKYLQIPGFPSFVFDPDVPQLQVAADRYAERLARLDVAVVTLIYCIGKSVTAGVLCLVQRFGYRLPGDAPVIACLRIPQVHVMSRSVHRD